MRYVVSSEKRPHLDSQSFFIWDRAYSSGFMLVDYYETFDEGLTFTERTGAELFASNILDEGFFDEVYIVAVEEEVSEYGAYVDTIGRI